MLTYIQSITFGGGASCCAGENRRAKYTLISQNMATSEEKEKVRESVRTVMILEDFA